MACSISVAPRPPYSFGHESPAYPASCNRSCHFLRNSKPDSSPLGSSPGWFSSSQARSSSRNSCSLGESVRSTRRAAYRPRRSTALLAALAAGGRPLRLVAAAAGAARLLAAAAAAALAAPARRSLRVRDRGRAGLAHPLLAQPLVLLVVLHA